MSSKLPEPECQYGYTQTQIEEILGGRVIAFHRWMYGQTFALCDGRKYDYEAKECKPTGCGPHGGVYYVWDVERFLLGLPIVD